VIAFNGEIYNHLALRQELRGPWRGHSDTETLLAAIEAWGLEAALQRCAGMFARPPGPPLPGRANLRMDQTNSKNALLR